MKDTLLSRNRDKGINSIKSNRAAKTLSIIPSMYCPRMSQIPACSTVAWHRAAPQLENFLWNFIIRIFVDDLSRFIDRTIRSFELQASAMREEFRKKLVSTILCQIIDTQHTLPRKYPWVHIQSLRLWEGTLVQRSQKCLPPSSEWRGATRPYGSWHFRACLGK